MAATYTKPTTIPRWADTSGNVVEPSSGKKDAGWLVKEKAISSWENWKAKLIGDWFKWIDERVADGATKDVFRFLCPGTGVQTLEIDDNVVRFFEVGTPSQQMSIRKSTSGDETQIVLSESGTYDYPVLAYNRATEKFSICLERAAIGDDVDDTEHFSVTKTGFLTLRGPSGPRYHLFNSSQTGVGSVFRLRLAGKELQFAALDENFASVVDFMTVTMGTTNIWTQKWATVFQSDNPDRSAKFVPYNSGGVRYSPIVINALTADPTVVADGDLWRFDDGTTDEFRARLNGKTVSMMSDRSLPVAQIWGRFRSTGGAATIYQGISYNVSGVSLPDAFTFRVSFTGRPLKQYSCVAVLGNTTVAANYNFEIATSVSDPCQSVDVKCYIASSGAGVNFTSTTVYFDLVIFGELN